MNKQDFRRIALKVYRAKRGLPQSELPRVIGAADYELVLSAREASAAKAEAETEPPAPPAV